MMKLKQNKMGFTLIELMIVVAIVGILSAVAYPTFTDQVRKARRVDGVNLLTQCASQQERAYTINNTYNLVDLCGVVDSGTYYSADGYYSIVVTNPGGAGCTTTVGATTRNNCFTAVATAVTGKSQASDSDCKSFTLTHLGVKSSKNSSSSDSSGICWRD